MSEDQAARLIQIGEQILKKLDALTGSASPWHESVVAEHLTKEKPATCFFMMDSNTRCSERAETGSSFCSGHLE